MGRARTAEQKPRIALWLEADNHVRELRADEAARVLERYPVVRHEYRKFAGMTRTPGGRLIVIEQRFVAEITGWLDSAS